MLFGTTSIVTQNGGMGNKFYGDNILLGYAADDSIRDIFKDNVLTEFDRIENTDPEYNYYIAVGLHMVTTKKLFRFLTQKMGPIE
jgi:hypothetical protein